MFIVITAYPIRYFHNHMLLLSQWKSFKILWCHQSWTTRVHLFTLNCYKIQCSPAIYLCSPKCALRFSGSPCLTQRGATEHSKLCNWKVLSDCGYHELRKFGHHGKIPYTLRTPWTEKVWTPWKNSWYTKAVTEKVWEPLPYTCTITNKVFKVWLYFSFFTNHNFKPAWIHVKFIVYKCK